VRYTVLKYGREELRRKSVPVQAATEEIRRLARDMIETMRASNGVGLAAQQIGRDEAVCVIDTTGAEDKDQLEPEPAPPPVPMPLALLNPRIVSSEGVQTGREGCLSFPEIYVKISRASRVTVEYTDLDGQHRSLNAEGLLARAVQHEVDHLNGILLADRMSLVQRASVSGRLKKLRREAQPES
jgi:peptide deformylase